MQKEQCLNTPLRSPYRMQQNSSFLKKDLSRAHLISHLYFELYECSLESQELLQHALTSIIESISCHVWNDHFINFFMDIIEKSF